MSIINEALKKAESTKEFKPIYSDKFRQTIEAESHKRSKQVNWGPIFVLMVLFLITGPLIAPVFSTPFRKGNLAYPTLSKTTSYLIPAQSTALTSVPASQTRQAQFGLEEAPRAALMSPQAFAPMAPSPRFTLTGIVYADKSSFCILNNTVVKLGQELNGAKLVDVQPHQIKLLYHGEEMTLTIRE